jgi:hypothetical protein
MKQRGLQNSKRVFAALTLLAAILFQIPIQTAQAATAGTAPCVQNVDVTNGVSVFQSAEYCFVAFKTVGSYTWTPPTGVTKIDLLVVAGGGGGAARHGGGGGAGGLINATNTTINSSNLSISVGGGGSGAAANTSVGGEGSSGSNSVVSGGGITTQTAVGGGNGSFTLAAGSGGSGGGGGCCGQAVGTGTAGQGNSGSAGSFSSPTYWVGGGGGGASASGGTASGTTGGKGGDGRAISWITTAAQSSLSVGAVNSSQVYFAGGGGGGTDRNTIAAGAGGLGGGGAGGNDATTVANSAANTGGGGGGSGCYSSGGAKAGDGGSGVVVIRYSIPTFSNSATASFAENTTVSTNVLTISVNESATYAIKSTLDYTFFNLVYVDTVTSRLRFITSPDFEAKADAGANNDYDIVIRATDVIGNYSEFAIKITVTDVNENPTIDAPTLSTAATKGVAVTITVITDTPGKVQFLAQGKKIPNCLSRATSGSYPNYTASCSWKPNVTGSRALNAIIKPTNGALASITSSSKTYSVSKRTNNR